jgi:hypothetical protein
MATKNNKNEKALQEAKEKIARQNQARKVQEQPVEISVSLFERNAKIYNKKGLRRSFASFGERYQEFLNVMPLSARNKFVLEATIDKSCVEAFIKLLKDNEFEVLGSLNYYNLENACKDYEANKAVYASQAGAINAISKDVELMKKDEAEYKEIENEDCLFYFLPYNSKVDTLFEFVSVYKDVILNFARENDITIMLKVTSYCNQVEGFFGFNFFHADQKEETVVDFASRVSVVADLNSRVSVFNAGLLLSGVGENEDELNVVNTHVVVQNIKYTQDSK